MMNENAELRIGDVSATRKACPMIRTRQKGLPIQIMPAQWTRQYRFLFIIHHSAFITDSNADASRLQRRLPVECAARHGSRQGAADRRMLCGRAAIAA
jgi:hypothetical protein